MSDLILPGGSGAELTERYQHAVMNTFGPPKRVFTRGEGCYVWDVEGKRYLDLLAGIAVNALGHAHPQILGAITAQLSTLGHVSNFFATPAQIALAEQLTTLVTGDSGTEAKVFFANSGTEANEAAFKLTRRTGRTRIVAMEGCFHGRSMGALALTHTAKYREPFEPLPGHVTWVPFGDAAALEAAVDDTVAAVLIEPIQGESGVVVPPEGFLVDAQRIAHDHGALLWLDEVQTGMGRTGQWLAAQHDGVVPDVVTLAKGLGNGFPIGACVATGQAADLLQPGSHGSTFGGNPVASVAALAVIQIIKRDGLLDHVTAMGEHLAASVAALGHPRIKEVRGRGLLRAIVLTDEIAPRAYDRAMDLGFVINAPRPDVLRIAPPLVVTAEQLDTFVAALPDILDGSTP
ncbi:acetylornithine transaminase [Granulicoccus sp. GXG6511]|uniref:acetylornithine transaminase n=1 Tax=Granulicoccus sp. GXG6511 TaxID=3381351 RepID=UPI003D7E1EEC